MRREQIQQVLEAAYVLSNHYEFVIAGSLSVLGLLDCPPEFMSMSIDVDFYPLRDPDRANEIAQELGEGSPFHERYGFYLDAIHPELPTLPDGWRERLVERQLGSITALFLDVNDTAVSKYTRGADNDFRWIEAGYDADLLNMDAISGRMQYSTQFYVSCEKHAALSRLRMHQVATTDTGKLDHALLSVLHDKALEASLKDLDLNEGEYAGKVLWVSDSFIIQSLDNGSTAVHKYPGMSSQLKSGDLVKVMYQDESITIDRLDAPSQTPSLTL